MAPELDQVLDELIQAASLGGEPSVSVLADGGTNSLLISGPANHLGDRKSLIARLDVEVTDR